MDDDMNIWLKPKKPILLFNEFPHSEDQEYTILIYDMLNYETITVSKGSQYIIFKAKLLEGFDDMHLNLSHTYRIHFPKLSFEIALQRTHEEQIDSENCDCQITFKRPNRKKIIITEVEYLPVGNH